MRGETFAPIDLAILKEVVRIALPLSKNFDLFTAKAPKSLI
jgi:hypothetical protein